MTSKYYSASIPIGLANEIRKCIGEHGAGYGYVSVSDFVKDACRRRLEEVC